MDSFEKRLRDEEKKNNKLVVILVSLIAATIVIIAVCATILFTTQNNNNSGQVQTNATEQVSHPTLYVGTCPEQVNDDNPTVTLTGTIKDDVASAVLTINDEIVCDYSGAEIGTTKDWSKTVTLNSGSENIFNIVLKDSNGVTATESRSVFCQTLQEQKKTVDQKSLGPLRGGCQFVKKLRGGLNIREYPSTYSNIVDYIPDDDYTSTMLFVGKYDVDYDNYTWYQIVAPNGQYGYVRSDLVERIN